MTLSKWNYEKHNYEDYEIPDDWYVTTFEMDMDKIVHCPHCGRQGKFGDTYTSLEIHTPIGIGYSVCEDCYEQEWKRRRYHKRNE